MHQFLRAIFTISSFVCFLSLSAYADEKVGTFTIDEVNLRSELRATENAGGSISFSDSSVGFRWRKDKSISAFLGVGSELLQNLPQYYSTQPENRLGFYEAYAEYEGPYGRIRMGLIPLNFGYDGYITDQSRVFNRSLVYSQRIIALRDEGVSFYTENNGYYTQLVVHNGEIDTESDGRFWVSGNWGVMNKRDFRAQLSLQTGDVKGELSTTSTSTLAGVENGKTAHWRNGLLFLNWHSPSWNVVLETGGGELNQNDKIGRYITNMFEATHYFSKNFGTGVRYDELDPNRKVSGDKTTEMSLMLAFKSDDSTSNVYLIGTKVKEERNEINNDQLRLVWLLTPYVH